MPRGKPRPNITQEQFNNHEYCPGCLRATPNGVDDYKNFLSGNPTKTCRDCRNSVIKSSYKGKLQMNMKTKNKVLSKLVSEINDGILSLLNEKLAEFDKIAVEAQTKYVVKQKEENRDDKKNKKQVNEYIGGEYELKPKKKIGRPRKEVIITDSDSDGDAEEDNNENDNDDNDDSSVDAKEIVNKIKDLCKDKQKNK